MKYGSAAAMVAWLDRDEIAAERERKLRRTVRKLSPRQRKFVLALRHVLEVVPGPQDLHREKIMKRLKTGRRMYFYQLSELHKTLV